MVQVGISSLFSGRGKASVAKALRVGVVYVLVALGGVCGAYAQTAPTRAPAVPGGMTATELEKALAATFTPSHLALAADVLRGSGLVTMFDNSLPNVVGNLRVNITRQRPELTKEIEESLKVVESEIAKVVTDGVNGAGRLLAIRLSEAELKEVNTFLTSATGKKYVAALPQMMEHLLPFLEIWKQEAGNRLMQVFRDEMAKRGHKI